MFCIQVTRFYRLLSSFSFTLSFYTFFIVFAMQTTTREYFLIPVPICFFDQFLAFPIFAASVTLRSSIFSFPKISLRLTELIISCCRWGIQGIPSLLLVPLALLAPWAGHVPSAVTPALPVCPSSRLVQRPHCAATLLLQLPMSTPTGIPSETALFSAWNTLCGPSTMSMRFLPITA